MEPAFNLGRSTVSKLMRAGQTDVYAVTGTEEKSDA